MVAEQGVAATWSTGGRCSHARTLQTCQAVGPDHVSNSRPPQITKALQLQLACEQRIGVILVGPSGSGKTALWQLLEEAHGRLGHRPTVHR
jgi:ABC-type multidrug transport system fused ATPase/permease subunit